MKKSCENCYEWCGEEQGCDSDNAIICKAIDEHPYWKPDYQTLESENAELKQRISELEKASDEFERIANKSMNQQDILIDENDELKDENDELKQELEVCKRALYLTTRARFFERMEHPYEDDIQAEIDWFLGMAKRWLAK